MTQNKSEDSPNKATLPNDSTTETENAKAKPSRKRPNKQSEPSASQAKTATRIAVAAMVLSLATTAGLYWHGHQFREHTNAQLHLLNTSLAAKEQNLMTVQTNNQASIEQLKQHLNDLRQVNDALSAKLDATEQHRQTIEQQLALLNIKDANHWRLNEANYLLQLAAHKLWLEHDVATAIALLVEADASINHAQDPHLLPLRRAINNDISVLKALPLTDKEGIAFRLEGILQQTEQLKLAEIDLPQASELLNNDLSSDSADWQSNLLKSWRKFSENFITVRRRDGQVEALVEPQHAWYLKENLKLQIQQAEQALFRSQGELFKAKLQRAATWISSYFMQNTQAQALIDELQQLQQLTIVDSVPEQLSSLNAAEKAIKERQQRLLPSLEGDSNG
ncbi:uroporphyrinogen-III C-methyltransferase [Agarivorans sp.]|uniref:uroporphyrinogen-III C-methyltransferase n=1 Tax=Agarivorans sp. TaxID=1872412 RepID=UPI003D05D268